MTGGISMGRRWSSAPTNVKYGGDDVLSLHGLEIVGVDLHADFHRGFPDAVDGGFEDEDVAMSGGGLETDRIDTEGDATSARVAFCNDSGHQVAPFDQSPAKQGAQGIQVVGEDN